MPNRPECFFFSILIYYTFLPARRVFQRAGKKNRNNTFMIIINDYCRTSSPPWLIMCVAFFRRKNIMTNGLETTTRCKIIPVLQRRWTFHEDRSRNRICDRSRDGRRIFLVFRIFNASVVVKRFVEYEKNWSTASVFVLPSFSVLKIGQRYLYSDEIVVCLFRFFFFFVNS